ncbi:MAG: CoA-binding protein [Bacillus sp. (in: firmicutes)]
MDINELSRDDMGKILKKAKRIAVVGLSDQPHRTSYSVSKAMQDSGYEIIPVNPDVQEVLGVKAVASLLDIEGHVDIVNVFRRSEAVAAHAKEFEQIDADVFWTQLGVIDEDVYYDLKNKGYTVIMNRCIKVEHALTK